MTDYSNKSRQQLIKIIEAQKRRTDDLPLHLINEFKGLMEKYKHKYSCCICLEDTIDSKSIEILPNCGHIYHKKCISEWKKTSNDCPYCRKQIRKIRE